MNGSQISTVFLSICASALAFIVSYILLFNEGQARRQVSQRVAKFTEKPKSTLYALKKEKMAKSAATAADNVPFLEHLGNELLLADIIVKPEEFLAFWLCLIFVPAGLVGLFTSKLIPSITLAVVFAFLPPWYVNHQKKKRTALFESQLGDALIVMCNCIRSGLTFQQALETSADQMDPPISQEFARVVREIKYGNSLEKALNNMVKRVGSEDLMLAVSAVNIQRQTGGNLSEILENISVTIKDRQKIKDDIRVLTATGRISGLVIGLLPIVIGLILLLMNPDYILLFFKSTLGIAMLIVAAVMETIGFLVVKKITTVKY